MGGNLKHQQMQRNVVQHVVDPSQALNSVLLENERLKEANGRQAQQISQMSRATQSQEARLKSLAMFEQIVKEPIPLLTITLKDKFIIDQLRDMMVRIFGPGGELDMKGNWAQTVVNQKLQLLLSECIRYGHLHFSQLVGRVRVAEGVPNGRAGMAQVGNPAANQLDAGPV